MRMFSLIFLCALYAFAPVAQAAIPCCCPLQPKEEQTAHAMPCHEMTSHEMEDTSAQNESTVAFHDCSLCDCHYGMHAAIPPDHPHALNPATPPAVTSDAHDILSTPACRIFVPPRS